MAPLTEKYSWLFAEKEPHVIGVDMIRECIELPKGDPEQVAEKKKIMKFRDVDFLAFSYKELVKIENLAGFDSLTKLKLDCNRITTIEGLGHLTNLTRLDLSFNQIQKIEGLATLKQLTDLSLQDNLVSELEGLEELKKLQCFSIGNNHLNKLDRMLYLRQFSNLESVNLAGNPICREANYKSYMLSHMKHLKYLDYVRVKSDDVQAAIEHHQDEVVELREKEEAEEEEAKAVAKASEAAALMHKANLDGVGALFDDMIAGDDEWARLSQVPTLLDHWSETRERFEFERDNFKAAALEKHALKTAEISAWKGTVQQACAAADATARGRVAAFTKRKKHLVRDIRLDPQLAANTVPQALEELETLKKEQISAEMQMVEVLDELLQSFERSYSELVESSKQLIMSFFNTARDLEGTFHAQLVVVGQKLYDEKYGIEGSEDLESLSEDARMLMSDKDALLNTMQTSHDTHTSKLDAVEDSLLNQEASRAASLITQYTEWAHNRNRDRIVEIISFTRRNQEEVAELLNGREEEEDGG